MNFRSPTIGLLLFLTACSTVPLQPESLVAGRVTLDGRGAAQITVNLHPASDPSGPGSQPVVTAVTDREGRFNLRTRPGDYFLTATGSGLFGYYGHNPLSVPPQETMTLSFQVIQTPSSPHPGEEGMVTGMVISGKKPAVGVQVTAYTDANQGFRGPGLAVSTPTGPDGRFFLPLGPGRYFLIAKGRSDGGGFGPLRPGDRFGYYPHNPVTIDPGRGLEILFPMVTIPSQASQRSEPQPSIVLEGVVIDENGRPAPGYRACLFGNSELLNRPLFFSPPAASDGRFRLEVSRPGRYFLGARQRLGGPPESGERIGWPQNGGEMNLDWADHLTGLVLILEAPVP